MSLSFRHPAAAWRSTFDTIDRHITFTMESAAIPVPRIALGVVVLWFGALKFFPGLSPAQDLAARTPTLEGQYIIKTVVLVAAAIVIGATVRGGRLQAEPTMPAQTTPARRRCIEVPS